VVCVGEAVNWYLIQTKRGKERCVHDKLATMVAEVFLPILKTRASRQGHRRGAWGTSPLFPRYLFAKFDLGQRYFDVKYMPGVGGVVSAGAEPLTVPPLVVDEIKRRSINGVVEPVEDPLRNGDCVRVVDGPFKGFEAIFDRYLSTPERVAILLSTLETNGLRIVLPVDSVARREA
jgi:transcriptional antiterminator RfaH